MNLEMAIGIKAGLIKPGMAFAAKYATGDDIILSVVISSPSLIRFNVLSVNQQTKCKVFSFAAGPIALLYNDWDRL